jgi:hypothetical protein
VAARPRLLLLLLLGALQTRGASAGAATGPARLPAAAGRRRGPPPRAPVRCVAMRAAAADDSQAGASILKYSTLTCPKPQKIHGGGGSEYL